MAAKGEPRLDVVEGVDDHVEPLPEGVIEDRLGRGRHALLQRGVEGRGWKVEGVQRVRGEA